jgi:hypothetical protein
VKLEYSHRRNPERYGCGNHHAGRETGQGGDDVRVADGEDQVGVSIESGEWKVNRKNMFLLITKRLLWTLAIAVLVLGWLALSGFNLYCAIFLTCSSESISWWSLLITLIGLPILFSQLYLLRRTIVETIKEPRIGIGLLPEPINNEVVFNKKPLPTKQVFDLKYMQGIRDNPAQSAHLTADTIFPLRLVVANSGSNVAQQIKIKVSIIAYPTDEKPFFGVFDTVGKKFKPLPNYEYVFNSGNDRPIFPDDFEVFSFFITRGMEKHHELFYNSDVGDFMPVGIYKMKCVVWADKMSKSASQIITIEVVDSRDKKNALPSKQQAYVKAPEIDD